MPPEFCVDHLGRWGQDPMCGACRTITGKPRRGPRTRLVWRSDAVGMLVILALGVGLWAGLNLPSVPGFPFHP